MLSPSKYAAKERALKERLKVARSMPEKQKLLGEYSRLRETYFGKRTPNGERTVQPR